MVSKSKQKNSKKKQIHEIIESDENFAFIAGYTSNGFAYGIADSWKQKYKRRSAMMDELKKAGF
ncbi:MAG: hypothetical protein ACI4F0_10720 [Agathobacter sp.]